LLTIRYSVVLPVVQFIPAATSPVSGFENISGTTPDAGSLLILLYLSGIIIIGLMIMMQSRSVLRALRKADIITSTPVKLVRTADYSGSFSFFSFVFVNPSVTDIEMREIMNHEMVHIRQKHWIDLVLGGLLCMLQWFNPLVWIFVRFIRQNHEYIADEVALQRTSDPAVYRATLLNQIAGSPVVRLANSFNYSLNKKRFDMMKNIIISPYRKLKVLLILPVFAIVLYAFAKPDYIYSSGDADSTDKPLTNNYQTKEVKGFVHDKGKALEGAAVIVSGTTLGTVTNADGYFKLEKLPDDFLLVVSYVGFKTKVIKPVFNAEMVVSMLRDTINIGRPLSAKPPAPAGSGSEKNRDKGIPPPPPPPPTDSEGNVLKPSFPANSLTIRSKDGGTPLIVVNGMITDIEANKIDPSTIQTITVIKDQKALEKYGEKARDGAIEITTWKVIPEGQVENPVYIEVSKTPKAQVDQNIPFVVVEDMPEFPGGREAMLPWIAQNLKYPQTARQQKIEGTVQIIFVVSSEGKVGEVVALRSDNQIFNEEAIRVVSSMPLWKPGSQNGKKVNVYYMLPVEFKL
jgi:TonB family protein